MTVGTDDPASPAPGSLRWAIDQANTTPGQDTISIAPGLSITLAAGVNVEDGTDVIGDPADPATITLGDFDAFQVDTPTEAEQFSFQHVTVTGTVRVYHAPQHLLLDDSTFLPSASGGENHFQTSGRLTVRNSTFNGTYDVFSSLADDCSDSAFSLTDSRFNGGYYVKFETDCDLRLERVSVTDREGGTLVNAGDVVVVDSTFADNRGRGMSLYQATSFALTGSTFENNEGGLTATNDVSGPITIERSVFRGNEAVDDGGALNLSLFSDGDSLSIVDSIFENNVGQDNGGAISIDSADLTTPVDAPLVTILRSTFSGNRAVAGKSLYLSEVEGNPPGTSPVARITNSTFNEPQDPAIADGADVQSALEEGVGSVIYGFEETEERPVLWVEHSTIVGGGITVGFTGEGTSVRLTNTVVDSGPFDALNLLGADDTERPAVQGEGNIATRPGPLAPVSAAATRAELALAPLADNGGLTPTRLPGRSSVLIDAGVASSLSDDQRRFARDARPDVGAVEAQLPTVSIQPLVEVTEGSTARLTVTIRGRADHPGTIRVTSHDGTASSGTDYTALDTELSWPAGATDLTRTVEVPALDRSGAQGDRELTVRLSDAVGSRIGDPEGRVLIHDDSESPTPTPTTPTDDPTPTPTPDPTSDPTESESGTDGNHHTATPTATQTSAGVLPDTGSSTGPLAVLVGLALVLAGAVATLASRRRRGTH